MHNNFENLVTYYLKVEKITPTSLRLDPLYFKIYLIYLNLFIHGIIPFILLVFFNIFIYRQVSQGLWWVIVCLGALTCHVRGAAFIIHFYNLLWNCANKNKATFPLGW